MLARSGWKPWKCTVLWLIPCHVAHMIGPLITEARILSSHWDVAMAWRRLLPPPIRGWWVWSHSYGSYHAPRWPAHQHLFSWMTDSFRRWVMATLRRSRAYRSGFMAHPPQITAGRTMQCTLGVKWSPTLASLCSSKITQAISRVVESFLSCPCSVTNAAQRRAATVCPLSMPSVDWLKIVSPPDGQQHPT